MIRMSAKSVAAVMLIWMIAKYVLDIMRIKIVMVNVAVLHL